MAHHTNDDAHPSRRAALCTGAGLGTLAAATLAGIPFSPAHARPRTAPT
ncbi:hypothetical protein [Nocardiopsis sp. CNR-923]|nr:hypothetical protein [Nocardiopsis sp. CNR-923]